MDAPGIRICSHCNRGDNQRMRTLTVPIAAAAVFVALASSGDAQGPASTPGIKEGSGVSLEYPLSGGAGKVLDSNKGAEAFAYTQGAREIVPGLEAALVGLKAGDVKQVTVKP